VDEVGLVGEAGRVGVEECVMIVDRHHKWVVTQVAQTVEGKENSARKSNSMSNAPAGSVP
jgi:hypothetical protein